MSFTACAVENTSAVVKFDRGFGTRVSKRRSRRWRKYSSSASGAHAMADMANGTTSSGRIEVCDAISAVDVSPVAKTASNKVLAVAAAIPTSAALFVFRFDDGSVDAGASLLAVAATVEAAIAASAGSHASAAYPVDMSGTKVRANSSPVGPNLT